MLLLLDNKLNLIQDDDDDDDEFKPKLISPTYGRFMSKYGW